MKKIWDNQQGEMMYAINEEALHSRIKSKKKAANKRINKVEIGLMLINFTCSVILFIDALDDPHYWDFFGSAMMLGTVIYLAASRYRRKKAESRFDRTILGELDHAIANTNSIIRISRLMIYGYLLPFSFFYIGKMVSLGASFDRWLIIFGLYLLAFILITWERKHLHIPRKQHLEVLREKLIAD